jgi:hypothetical protein
MIVGFVKPLQLAKNNSPNRGRVWSSDFSKKFSSNQGSRAKPLHWLEKVIYNSVPMQEVTFQAKEYITYN